MDSRNDTLNELQSKPDVVELLSRKQKATEENASQTQKSLQCDFDDDKKLFALMRQMEENRDPGLFYVFARIKNRNNIETVRNAIYQAI